MKLQFPCKEHDFEQDGNVRCWELVNKKHCDHAAKCMLLVERELCDVMNAPKKLLNNQEETKEVLVKELEHQPEPEFAEAS